MRKVKTDLRNKNASEVLSAGRVVLLGMTANPHFPTPFPALNEFRTACDALEACILKVENGGSRSDYLSKSLRQEEVANMLRALAGYVGAVAQGHEGIVQSAGFALAKPSVRITSMDAPKEVVARSGTMPRTIKVSWKPVKGTRLYNLYICQGDPRDDSNWRLLCQTSSSRYLVTDLAPLEYYAFRVEAQGASTTSPLSDQATALSIGVKAA